MEMAHQLLYAFIGMMMKTSRYLTFLSLKGLSPGSNHPLAHLPPIPLLSSPPLSPLPSLLTLPSLTHLLNLLLLPTPYLFPMHPRFVQNKNNNKLYANIFNKVIFKKIYVEKKLIF